jgi:hypothetical protein
MMKANRLPLRNTKAMVRAQNDVYMVVENALKKTALRITR